MFGKKKSYIYLKFFPSLSLLHEIYAQFLNEDLSDLLDDVEKTIPLQQVLDERLDST
jgi:hypothetical protein